MRKFISLLLSLILALNLVGCSNNDDVTKQAPTEEPKVEEQVPVETAWMNKTDFIEFMKEALDEYGLYYEYGELTDVNNDPVFALNENVGIIGYVDANDNVIQISVIGTEDCAYEDYQLAGQLFGIAVMTFTEDAEFINDIVTIFDQEHGTYETDDFNYEYIQDGMEVFISITPNGQVGTNPMDITTNGEML